MKNRFDAVLFDFDGTLVDSSEGIFNSLIYAFEQDGKELSLIHISEPTRP